MSGTVADLRRRVNGEVVSPEDAPCETARMAFGVRLQSTGHAPPTGSGRRHLGHDGRRGRAGPADRPRAGGGALGPGAPACAEHGLAGRAGSSAGAGVVGYALGGGTGWLGRPYGLAGRAVTAADVVTAAGERMRIDAETAPDLPWAIKGGAGAGASRPSAPWSSGSWRCPASTPATMIWPLGRVPEVLPARRAWLECVPERLTSVARMLRIPPLPTVPEPLRGGRPGCRLPPRRCGVAPPGRALRRPQPEAAALDHLDAGFLLWGLGVPLGPATLDAIEAALGAVEEAAAPLGPGAVVR